MRDIKFRAWDSELNEWCDADIRGWNSLFDLSQDSFSNKQRVLKFENSNHPEVVIMQYTGVKDKNGVEIYEGDIVKCNGFISDIKWSNSTGYKIVDRLTCRIMNTKGYSYLGSRNHICEVIGNKYENKELLEGI